MSMSSFRAAPRIGHLMSLQSICWYLTRMNQATIRFQTHQPNYTDLPAKVHDWWSIYGKVSEIFPVDIPEPVGKSLTFTHYVDAILFHDTLTERSVMTYYTW